MFWKPSKSQKKIVTQHFCTAIVASTPAQKSCMQRSGGTYFVHDRIAECIFENE